MLNTDSGGADIFSLFTGSDGVMSSKKGAQRYFVIERCYQITKGWVGYRFSGFPGLCGSVFSVPRGNGLGVVGVVGVVSLRWWPGGVDHSHAFTKTLGDTSMTVSGPEKKIKKRLFCACNGRK